MPPGTHANADRPLYVGYLPAPAAHGRLAWRVAISLPVLLALLAGALAIAQGPVGQGTWDDAGASTLTGVLRTDPYPRLIARDDRGAPLEVILVEQGKYGADARAAGLDGRTVTARGGLIRWGAQAVLELQPLTDALRPDPAQPEAGSDVAEPGERVTLRGEIVDPKCWLGVMNPGRSKTHLSCAELCIRGGIPPVLMVRDPDRPEGRCYLLTLPSGKPAGSAVRGRIGFPVAVTGRVTPGAWAKLEIESIDP